MNQISADSGIPHDSINGDDALDSLNTVESEYRAALTTEAEADAGGPDVHGLTSQEREFRELTTKAELRMAFRAVMNGDPLDWEPRRSCRNIEVCLATPSHGI